MLRKKIGGRKRNEINNLSRQFNFRNYFNSQHMKTACENNIKKTLAGVEAFANTRAGLTCPEPVVRETKSTEARAGFESLGSILSWYRLPFERNSYE